MVVVVVAVLGLLPLTGPTPPPPLQVKANLHVLLCFSPIGEPIRVRARRFPALVNCVVIDWFQPWPEDALASVSKRFLAEVDLPSDEIKAAVTGFMPYSFLEVDKASKSYLDAERRVNYTTPKSFLELIFLYKSMLAKARKLASSAWRTGTQPAPPVSA